MLRPNLHLALQVLLLQILAVAVVGKHFAPFARNVTRTASAPRAVQARQLTRAHLVERAEKRVFAQLFGRVDCAVPEPSTLACPCVDWDSCGGNTCFDLNNDDAHCGSCGTPACTGAEPACCAGECADLLNSRDHCGICTRSCGLGSCCDGDCIDTQSDPANCGSCGNDCGWMTCCDGECVDTMWNDQHCAECGNACPAGQFCNCDRCSATPRKFGKRC